MYSVLFTESSRILLWTHSLYPALLSTHLMSIYGININNMNDIKFCPIIGKTIKIRIGMY
jgi:hypothetical protein